MQVSSFLMLGLLAAALRTPKVRFRCAEPPSRAPADPTRFPRSMTGREPSVHVDLE